MPSTDDRDFLAATRERVVVFDGGMGATLEQFELTSEDYGGLAGKCHEALVLNRPDVIEGVHASMLEAGAEVLETDTFQGSRIKLDEWGLGEETLEINTKAAEIAREAAGEARFVAGSIGPTGYLPASDDPTLGAISFRELVEVFAEQARGLVDGRRRPDHHRDRAGHPRGQGGDLRRPRGVRARPGATLPIQTSVSLLPQGGKMLLGTDIAAVLTTLAALDVDVIGLNCSTGPEDMRDAIRFLGEHSPLPVHCIPNAGLPLQGPDGETIFPETPEQLSSVLGEFVERHGVGIVGGCCGTTPDHIRAIAERVAGRVPGERPRGSPPLVSSMMAATDLVQEPRPTLVGERVNSQGSRKAKELLLADDYDGLVQVAEDQVEGGAHVLDICVALTERQDEDVQMREVVKRVSLTQPAPIQVDSTEPEVIEAALEQIPGRAIVNSINLEAGRDKADRVIPLARQHGAALIALTIDETGMAKTAERKLEIAQRIDEIACDEHGLDPELLIFDALTFTLTTGDEEWRPSAVETIEGIKRDQGRGSPGSRPRSASPTSRSASRRRRARCSTPCSCITASRRGSTWRWSTPTTSRRTPRSPRTSASSPTTSSTTAARTRSSGSSRTSSRRAKRTRPRPATRPRGWSPRRRFTGTSCAARRRASRTRSTRSVEKIGAVPTLNQVLLPAMKEVGDKFGAGELILPFVLQSAEVMKRAVAQLENYLDRIEGHTKGKVVIATVFGDVHDIGKSLVNTILTNNGYTVVDLGKQVPIDTIIDAAVENEADAIGLSALLVSTSKQMPACIAELHSARARVPGADRRGRDQPRLRPPGALPARQGVRRGLRARGLLLQGRLRRARHGRCADRRGRARVAGGEDARRGARAPQPPGPGGHRSAGHRRLGAFVGAHRHPDPLAAVLGRARGRDRPRPRSTPTWIATCCSSSTGAGGARRARSGGEIVEGHDGDEGFAPKLERMWREADYLHPRARLGYFPCNADGNELVIFDPDDHEREIERLVFPRQPKHDRICLADFYRPLEYKPDGSPDPSGSERDVVALQAVTVGPEVTERIDAARARRRVRRAALHPWARGPGGRGSWPNGCTPRSAAGSGSTSTRAAATPGATRPAPSSPSTRRSTACWGSRRSGSRSRAARRWSPSSRRRRSSPTTRRRSTSG